MIKRLFIPLGIFLYTFIFYDYYVFRVIAISLYLIISFVFFGMLIMSYAMLNKETLRQALLNDERGSLRINMKKIMSDHKRTFTTDYKFHIILFLLLSSAFKLTTLNEYWLSSLILVSVVFQVYNNYLYSKISKFYYKYFREII